MRKDARANPDGWEAKQVARYEQRKALPKICSYCDTSGHTRAGCDDVKAHKAQFIIDANLWRTAISKWMKEVQLGVGALVQCKDAPYHHGDVYMSPRDDNYIAPVGLVMSPPSSELSHYSGIMNSSAWGSGNQLLAFERLNSRTEEAPYQKTIAVALPCIPGIVPRFGKGYYRNEQMDRNDRLNNVEWEVVSAAPVHTSNSSFLCPKQLRKTTKHHFAGPQEQTSSYFKTFGHFQRTQLQQYINGDIELSEMKDPEVPDTNT